MFLRIRIKTLPDCNFANPRFHAGFVRLKVLFYVEGQSSPFLNQSENLSKQPGKSTIPVKNEIMISLSLRFAATGLLTKSSNYPEVAALQVYLLSPDSGVKR